MVIKKRTQFQRFLLRCKIAFKIMFRESHIVAVYLSDEQFKQLVAGNTISGSINISYAGMMEHQCHEIISIVSSSVCDIEVACSKAEFEAEVIIKTRNKQ